MSGRAFPARIVKADPVRQIAYGVVLEPRTADNPDSQGDWYTAADIEKAAHGFLEAVAKGEGGIDLMHANNCGRERLERAHAPRRELTDLVTDLRSQCC